jgi:hypothetical protein
VKVINLLVQHGANPRLFDTEGYSCLLARRERDRLHCSQHSLSLHCFYDHQRVSLVLSPLMVVVMHNVCNPYLFSILEVRIHLHRHLVLLLQLRYRWHTPG